MKGKIFKIGVITKIFTTSLFAFLLFNSSVKAQLTGGNTYPINGVQNPPTSFSTVGRAFTYLNANGTTGTGTITLLISSGYAGDSGTIAALTAYPGMDASRPILLKPASGQSPTISTSPSANSAVIRFNGARYFTIDGSNNGTSSRDLTITTSSTTTTVRLVDLVPTASSSSKFITVKNVNLRGNSSTSAVNTLYGIYLGSGTGTGAAAVSGNDSNLFQNNVIEAVRNGIYLRGTNSAYDNYNRVLGNIIGGTVAPGGSNSTTYFGGATTIAGIYFNSQQNALIKDNTIRNSMPGFYYARGIHLEALTSTGSANKSITIDANRITDIVYNGSSGFGNQGVRIETNNNTANNIRLTNNFIADIAADGDNVTTQFNYGIFGIQLSSIASAANSNVGIDIYHNTINLYDNGAQKLLTRVNLVAACIAMQTNVAGGVKILNNILQNTYPGSGTNGKAVAIYVQNGSVNPLLPANNGRSNNNDLYVNGNNIISITGFLNSTDQGTLTTWKSNSVDSASISADASFLFNSVPYTYNNSLNNAGTSAGVTTDIDGHTRSVTTPDIGATEFTPPKYNIAMDQILNIASGCNLSQLNIQAKIKNLIDTIPSGDTIAFWYKVGSGAKVWDSAFLSSSIAGNNTYQFSFTQAYTFTTTGTYAVWVGFSYGKDTIHSNDSISVSITNAACLTGGTTYNINGTQNPPTSFATVADAFAHLNNNGTTGTGTIILLIASGYAGESTVIPPLNAYLGMDASRPIVLKPASGQTPTINTSPGANSAVIRFNGAKYFTIDGSNSGGSSRDLTITTGSTTTSVRLVDLVPTATSSCKGITVKNVHFLGNSTTSAINTYAGIYLGSGTASPGAALTSGNDSNLFQNNLVEAVRNGIWLQGTNVSGQYDQYNRVLGNTIGGTVAPGGSQNTTCFGGTSTVSGIYLNSQQNALIQGNLVRNSHTGYYYARGIHLEALSASGAANKDVTINANRIHSIVYAGSGEWANHGMRIQTNDNTGANILVTNNSIANIAADGFTYTTTPNFLIAGIQLASNASATNSNVGIKLYHNSINLFDNGTQKLSSNPASVGTACIVLEANVGGGVDIANNILQNTYPAVSTSNSKAYGIYVKNGSVNPFLPANNGRSNHNDFYINGSSTNDIVGYLLGSDQVSFTDWQNNNVDSNSLNVDAQYTDNLLLYTLSPDLNNKGIPVGVTKDIDNNNRSTSAPDLGISEYNPPTYNIAFVGIEGLSSGCNLGTKTIKVRYRNAGIFSIPAGDTIVFWYKADTAAAVMDSVFMPASVAPGDSFVVAYTTPFAFTKAKQYSFQVYANYNKDLFPENDSAVIMIENFACITSPSTVMDFETGDDGFTQTGGWVRGMPAKTYINAAGSGQNAWVVQGLTGQYSNNLETYLYSPSFDLTTGCQPSVTWKMRYRTENNFDAIVLEATTDNVNWTRVTSITPAYNANNTSGPIDGPKFTGDNSDWTTYTADLSTYANQPFFKFRFWFGSDVSGVNDGAAVDSVAFEFYPKLGTVGINSNLKDDTAYIKAPYQFTSTVANKTGVYYDWYLDSVLVDSLNASYTVTWQNPGSHVLKHIARNCAMVDSVIIPITVVTPVGLPTIDFISNKYKLNAGEGANLSSITGNGVFNWQWIISPDMAYDYLSQNTVPTYTYSGNLTSPNANLIFLLGGKYDVCLIAENINGVDTLCKSDYIEVFDVAGVCSFPTVPYPTARIFDSGMGSGNYANNENCTAVIELECADTIYLKLNNLQTELNGDYLRIYDGDEDPANALWDINQYPNGLSGSISGINNLPAVMKATKGYATIRFTSNGSVVSQGFELEYTSNNVTQKPTASFIMPDSSCPSTQLSPVFTGTGRGTTTYRWDIDGDNVDDYSGTTLSFQYATAGTYTVRLVASNCIGADTFYKTIVIGTPSAKPATAFSANFTNPMVGDEVILSDITPGCVQGVAWSISPNSFGYVKGTSASSKNPVVVFNAAGCYDVTLVTWNGIGYDTLKQTCYINVSNVCTPVTQLNTDIGISRVKLNTIDNQSAAGTQSYSNYANTISTVLVKGEKYELTVERPSNMNKMNRRAWIDFNQDGTFSASEIIAIESNAQTLQFKTNIRIPRNALSGYTRLRVAAAFTNGTVLPCGGFIGEFEDYRVIIITDTIKPVITRTGADTISLERGRNYTDPGATALDNADGDISGFIISAGTVDTMAVGTYTITYDVTDSSGNQAFTVKRVVIVTPDTTKPVLTLNGNAHDTINVFDAYTDLGASASDLVDGNLNAGVSIFSSNLDTSKVGTYTITYTVSDLTGNQAFISRLVTVRDTVRPIISLVGNNPLIWPVKAPYADPGYTVSDNYDTGLVATVTGTVNYNVVGTYHLFFNVMDNSGSTAATVTRTVIVADTVKPVVTLVGPDSVTMDVFTSYYELGATATDNYDNALPVVTVIGTIDTALVANQELKYVVTDSSGNTSDTVTRIVKVVDRVAPVIIVHDPIVIQRTQPKPNLADSVDYSDNYYPKQQLILDINENIDVNVEGYYTVEYKVTDPSGNVSQVAKGLVIVTRALGIMPAVINDNAVNVYPNPATDKAYVSMNFMRETNAKVTVYSMTGQKVMEVAPQGNFTEKIVELDLTSLSAGQYFVRVEGTEGVVTKKLVITTR